MARNMKWIEAITRIFEEEKKPLHYAEVATLIIERGYRKSVGATPANSVYSNLSSDIRENGEKSKFVKVQMGTFTLKKYLDAMPDDEDEDQESRTEKKYTSVVQAFGFSWNRNQVLWKSSPDLLGIQTIGATPVNFNKQIGVYLLHDGREILYIGQAITQSIGERLYQHTRDRLSGRWDRFSWFGFYSVDEKGNLNIYEETHRTLSIENIGNTLESILIESIEPRQNRKSGNKLSGLEYNQHEDPSIERKRAAKILEDLKNRL